MRQKSAQPAVSIIVPIFNEEENLPHLYGEVVAALEGWRPDFELILIDDGSRDRSWSVIEGLCKRDPRVKGVRFRGNFGQTAAVSAGFDLAEGELMVTMDGDLQNDPADIPALAESMETRDLDLVNGWRFHRKDPFLNRRLPSMIANGLISLITGVKLHDYGCSLKVYRKEIAKDLKLYGEQHRFIPALASLEGARVGEEKVNHRARRFGKSKYGISRTFRVVLDLITVKFLQNYSTKPLSYQGQLIDNFWIRFHQGKAVEWNAQVNNELLTKLITMDQGSCYLGECALVPFDSPINQSGLLFYNTLFDENACCHLALGMGFADTIRDFQSKTLDECRSLGVNDSMVHEDFMIGSADLSIDAVCDDGRTVPLFRNGTWAF